MLHVNYPAEWPRSAWFRFQIYIFPLTSHPFTSWVVSDYAMSMSVTVSWIHIKTYLLKCSSRGRVSIIRTLYLQCCEYANYAIKIKQGNLILCLKINVQNRSVETHKYNWITRGIFCIVRMPSETEVHIRKFIL